MQSLTFAVVALRISAVLYAVVTLLLGWFLFSPSFAPHLFGLSAVLSFVFVFCLGMSVFLPILITELKKHKPWAWVASVIVCCFFLAGSQFLFGVLGLIGLLQKDTRVLFFPEVNG